MRLLRVNDYFDADFCSPGSPFQSVYILGEPWHARMEQSGEEYFLILKRKLFRVQWPERKLHKKKGDKELERMKAESEGKKRRVCAPVGEIDQLAFHNVIISERSALAL